MSQQQKKSLRPLLFDLTHWCVLACIAWATYARPSYGPRLLELAGIWMGIINTVIVMLLTHMLFSKEIRDAVQVSRQKFSHLRKIHSLILCLVELAVFAWAGWLWCFGIKLASIFTLEIIFTSSKKNQEDQHQARQ